MAVLNSQLRLTLLDQVTARARGMMGTLQRMQGMARRTNAAMAMPMGGGMMAGIARTAAPFVGIYAMGRALSSTISTAGDFQYAMNRVGVLSGAAGTQLEALTAQAKELGRTTSFRASEAADAMGFLAMAGFKTNEIMDAMPGTLQLAAAAGIELANSADIVSNVLTGYNKPVSELTHVNDVLVKSFTSANTDLVQLGDAMKYVGPVASAAGVRFEETTTALALMGNAGIQGTMAGTSLRGAISRVLAPTKGMGRAMRAAGLNFTNAEGRLLPLADIIQQLEPHAEDAGLFMELFGQRAGPAMAALVSQGSDAFRKFDKDLVNSGGTAERVAKAQMDGFKGQMKAFWSAVEGAQIAVGTRLLPGLTSAMESFTASFGELTKFIDSLSSRITIVDRLSVAFNALAVGLTGDKDATFFTVLRDMRDAMSTGLFGDTETFFEDGNKLGELSNTFRRMGRNFRAFADDMRAMEFGTAFTSLSAAFKEMNGWGTFAAVFAGARAIQLLTVALIGLAKSPIFRLLMVAWAVSALIDAFKDADSISEFMANLGELSGDQIGAIAVTLGLMAASAWSLVKAFRSLRAPPMLTPGAPGAPAGGAALPRMNLPKMGPTSTVAPQGFNLRGFGKGLAAGVAYEGGKWAIESGLDAVDSALGIDPARKEQVDTSTGGILKRLFGGGADAKSPDGAPGPQSSAPIDLSSSSLATLLKPGDQVDANIVNPPQRPNITLNNTIYMQSGESPEDVGRRIGAEAAAVVGGSFSDGGL